jgi:hypothetical protein
MVCSKSFSVSPGEADDEVGADADARHGGAQLTQLGLVFQRRVVAFHRRQNTIRTRLHRQMQVFDQFRDFGVGLNQAVGKLQRVRRGVADTLDPVDRRHHADQFRQVGQATVVGQAAITVHVLPEQGHFTHAVFSQVNHFAYHVIERTADFFAAGIRHDAERAVLAAPLHYRDIGAWAVDARFRQMVKLFNLGERNVDLWQLGHARRVDHLRQAMQGLRTEHHVHVRRAIPDRRAFLACHTTANRNHHLRVGQFQLAPATQLRINAILGAFADGAGVKQDHISVFGARRDFQGLMFTQQIDHA